MEADRLITINVILLRFGGDENRTNDRLFVVWSFLMVALSVLIEENRPLNLRTKRRFFFFSFTDFAFWGISLTI